MSEKRDYVKEAYETFIKNVEGLDPTDPEKAVAAYFEKNATDELKARCAAEGKTAKGCWEFIVAVARKVGGNCHIDPGAVYAMAMHYFEDVPVDWDGKADRRSAINTGTKGRGDAPNPETEAEIGGGKNVAARNRGGRDKGNGKRGTGNGKAKKARGSQGFFFELLDAPEEEGGAE